MEWITCPLCDAPFVVVLDDKLKDEHAFSERMKAHIRRHSIEAILDRIDVIWADDYNEIYRKFKGEHE